MSLLGQVKAASPFGTLAQRGVALAGDGRTPELAFRLGRLVPSAFFLAFLAWQWLVKWPAYAASGMIGADRAIYVGAAARFLSGGGYYYPWQVAGPYAAIDPAPVLYPPSSLVLFAPFTVLPALLWWAIPLGVTAAVVVSWRPTLMTWALILGCLAFPTTGLKIVTGNPVIWATMFIALGTRFRWVAALGLLKFTVAPFALIGIRDRRWWLALGLAALPFCWLLPDYVAALRDFQQPWGPLYSVMELPLVAIPLVAWLGRARSPEVAAALDLRGTEERQT